VTESQPVSRSASPDQDLSDPSANRPVGSRGPRSSAGDSRFLGRVRAALGRGAELHHLACGTDAKASPPTIGTMSRAAAGLAQGARVLAFGPRPNRLRFLGLKFLLIIVSARII